METEIKMDIGMIMRDVRRVEVKGGVGKIRDRIEIVTNQWGKGGKRGKRGGNKGSE